LPGGGYGRLGMMWRQCYHMMVLQIIIGKIANGRKHDRN
jgi:hypothetical protein